MPSMRGYPIYVKATYLLLFFFLFISALSYGKFVLTPIILGGLFAILLTPIGNRLEKWGAHRMFSSFICVLIMVLLVLTVAFFGFRQVASFGSDAPNLINTLNAKLNTAEAFIERKTHLTPDKQIDWVKSKLTESISAGGSFLSTLSSTTSTLAIILLIPLYTFFFMFYRNKMQVFFEKITPEDQHYKVHQILHRIQEVVQSYLSGIIIVIVILSFILSTGLLVIGVPYAIFLAVMAAFLNVIPYLGILTSALFAAFIALLTGHSASAPLFVLGLFLATHLLESNILTPNIVGSKVSLNPLTTIIALIIGEEVWGIVGMILFIPLLGVIKVIFDNVEVLQPYGYLLGTEGSEGHSLSWSGILRKVKRLFIRSRKTNPVSEEEKDDAKFRN